MKQNKMLLSSGVVHALATSFTEGASQLQGFKMESFGTAADETSNGVIQSIKTALKESGLQGFAGARSKRVTKAGVEKRLRMESGAEEGVIGQSGELAENGDAHINPEAQEVELTEAQEKAGVIAAAMAGNPAEYAQKAIELTNEAAQHTNQSPIVGEATGTRVKLEAFDDSNFRDAVGYTVLWNVTSARQSNAVENMWPCLVLNADQSHVEITVQFQVFHKDFNHKPTGDQLDVDRVLLMEAIIDGSILDEDIIRVVPVVTTGANSSEHHFVDDAVIAHRQVTVENEEVTTGVLLPGIVHNMIGLGAAAIAGVTQNLNSSVQLAPQPKLGILYAEVENKDGVKSIIEISTEGLSRCTFLGNLEGDSRDVHLNAVIDQLALTAQTQDITGVPAAALEFLRTPDYVDHRIEYGLKVYGAGNLEKGDLEITPQAGKVSGIKIAFGVGRQRRESDPAIVAELTGNIKAITIIGFDPVVKRTNITRHQRGPLTNVLQKFEKYYVQPGSPFSTIFPAIEAQSNIDMIGPLTATRIKNDYYGIKALFRDADLLSGTYTSQENETSRSNLRAAGKYIMQPYYRHYEISMIDIVDSLRSKDKVVDAQYALCHVMNDAVIHGMRDSRLELALQVQTGDSEAKHTLAFLTNPILGKFMTQLGDPAIFASLPYPVVMGTHMSNLLGEYGSDTHELFIVAVRPGTQMDPLNHGHFLWRPEQASTLQVTRDNGTHRELVVQPSCEWALVCPWMLRFTITDLTAFVNSKTPINIAV